MWAHQRKNYYCHNHLFTSSEEDRSIKGPVLWRNWSCSSRRWTLAFLKVRVDVGRRGSPNDQSSVAALLTSFCCPFLLFILHQGLYMKSQTSVFNVVFKLVWCRGEALGDPQLAGHFGRAVCSAWINMCIMLWIRELWKSFVIFGAESDSSLLVSLGKPPGEEQEALAPNISPGMANALR